MSRFPLSLTYLLGCVLFLVPPIFHALTWPVHSSVGSDSNPPRNLLLL